MEGPTVTATSLGTLAKKDAFRLLQPSFLAPASVLVPASLRVRVRFNSTVAPGQPQPPPPPVKPPQPPPHAAAQASAASALPSGRTRPSFAVLAPTFLFTHVTLAWALVPPVYLFLRTTNLSNSLLAGPQGAWFLSRQVPDFIPPQLIDAIVGPPPPSSKGREGQGQERRRLTVEELLERLARRAVGIVWSTGRGAYGIYKGARGDVSEQDAIARAAVGEIRGGSKTREDGDTAVDGITNKILGATRKQAQGIAGDISFGQIRDGVAAWVLVKVLFPVRLPVSILLTPRVARALTAFFRRG
ncbi:hypothetical protein FA10DRAFT_286536 [Acaromyces ingoldii]|uniref:DUF1279 domain-containing protein n=1 Tax=Acaromyces ingoldii TaxID=215250 RepID=A0A316YS76_9BASI|nr:hypothetical protein FA10DRAFT_286536 [Acaromyces ingoldii]PWN90863.1 hypothetical protein FA10DRAFT_286536 [Acaromyces ingoldii]